jgi:hypothetical protein
LVRTVALGHNPTYGLKERLKALCFFVVDLHNCGVVLYACIMAQFARKVKDGKVRITEQGRVVYYNAVVALCSVIILRWVLYNNGVGQ